MSNIQLKSVPDELHEAARRRAEAEGKTLSSFILDLLRRELAYPSRDEWIARLESRDPVDSNIDVVAVLDAVRAERDAELAEAQR